MDYFTETGWMAFFSGTDIETGRQRGVEAWHPTTGEALVVDPQRGALRPVSELTVEPDGEIDSYGTADRLLAPGQEWSRAR
ncbi:hypothetical protein [Streptomyces sp. NBC_01565]|uniref:hypothetical protein n=1 Tax=unclassified Streptomyces TaxID=2593676 RepID=UPI0022557FBC|nr:hypothetical protein [Streptomyces sp. NBC_01565]MCX4546341.1 hypothetical protein [Streptomyces sp. NBC_01565]